MLGALKPVQGVRQDFLLLHSCCHPVRGWICSPGAGVEALRIGLDQVPFPLNAFPAPEEMIAEASETHALTESQRTDALPV